MSKQLSIYRACLTCDVYMDEQAALDLQSLPDFWGHTPIWHAVSQHNYHVAKVDPKP